ncbi:MAG TPA: tetratricopeptide repeat protein [Gemmatimonadaceae bacterium]|nr:tetratricopeptide repeat protein [Gemmatimonadaceae bacterium]
MSDEIRRLSEALARDPASLVFLQLGEELRRTGQLELAHKVSLRGLERHPYSAEAHHLFARVCIDRGELERALDEWDAVLRLAPDHVGALKGLGYVLFKQGKLEEAERALLRAAELAPGDPSIGAALTAVRDQLLSRMEPSSAGAPERRSADAARLFADILGDGEHTALLIDAEGLVVAGTYLSADGREVTDEVGAELCGVSDEAGRAMRHLGLGTWTSIVFEAEAATVAMAPAGERALLLVAADPSHPLGFVRRVLERCAARARDWLGGDA